MTMKWEKCSVDMSDVLAEAMNALPAQRRIMFGCPAYFVNGNMFTGVHQSNIILRLTQDDRRLMKNDYDEAVPFEPFPGRPMKEYVIVPSVVYDNLQVFRSWLDRSFKYAAALPPKQAKSKSVKKEK
jgi:TfoX/Sxy family transcriptional regulator of competence genes